MGDDIQYPDHFTKRLQAIWGAGFLSPGGPEEVGEIVKHLDLKEKTVLDIGFGIGGPAVLLARDFGAEVIGIDVEPQLLVEAEAHAKSEGVEIDLRIVKPGPLPFEDAVFDMVFSKDSLVHVPDKPAIYAEILRVLKPGGALAVSDWLGGTTEEQRALMAEFNRLGYLHFEMATATETEAALREAGFSDVRTRDRNAWYAALSKVELTKVKGPMYDELVELVGKGIVDDWLVVRKKLAEAADAGALRPTHVFGVKPVSSG